MSAHYLAIHHESYDRSTVLGVFDSFVDARDHVEAEAAKPDAYTAERLAVIQEWHGATLTAEHERDLLRPQVWQETRYTEAVHA